MHLPIRLPAPLPHPHRSVLILSLSKVDFSIIIVGLPPKATFVVLKGQNCRNESPMNENYTRHVCYLNKSNF